MEISVHVGIPPPPPPFPGMVDKTTTGHTKIEICAVAWRAEALHHLSPPHVVIGGSVDWWPERSLDLTPPNLFLWGPLNTLLYETPVNTELNSLSILASHVSHFTSIHLTYFGEGGSKYSLIRVPMGASDFSTEYYTYDDVAGDTSLQYFALRQFEDYQLKSSIIVFVPSQQIPYLKQIQNISSQDIKLFTAPWSAPYWMKDNGTAFGRSTLRLENYKPWAHYFVK
uniref:Glucosylceramidase n=1 Tax=Timema shepardi TaxID=629360 RepID=A0A7R9AVW6_TIMSH|nr:unnamed protein product [Timema shepardi]